eukprot:scaffold81098_cov46-Phaeocystis_antarctica.AAC.2
MARRGSSGSYSLKRTSRRSSSGRATIETAGGSSVSFAPSRAGMSARSSDMTMCGPRPRSRSAGARARAVGVKSGQTHTHKRTPPSTRSGRGHTRPEEAGHCHAEPGQRAGSGACCQPALTPAAPAPAVMVTPWGRTGPAQRHSPRQARPGFRARASLTAPHSLRLPRLGLGLRRRHRLLGLAPHSGKGDQAARGERLHPRPHGRGAAELRSRGVELAVDGGELACDFVRGDCEGRLRGGRGREGCYPAWSV